MSRLTLTLNSHSLSAYQSCDRKYWLGSIENLVPLKSYEPFEIGTTIHNSIYHMNRAKIRRPALTPVQNLNCGLRALYRSKFYQSLKDNEKEVFYATKLCQYSAWRQSKPWLIPIGAEVGFSKIIYEDRNVVFIYEGRIDDVSTFVSDGTKYLSWIDYKTESREGKYYVNRNQFLGYSWALGTNYGFIIPFGLQKEKEECFRLISVYHTKALISQWKNDTIQTFREIINKIPFGEKEFKRRRSSCDAGIYGLCQYTKICDSAASETIVRSIKRNQFKEEVWRSW